MASTRNQRYLNFAIALAGGIAAASGIFSASGPGRFIHTAITGQQVLIHGTGIYRHMSADVAIQGIAQDYITLFLAVPVLMYFALSRRSGGFTREAMYTGTLGYFFVSYTMYLCMGAYNVLFLVYAGIAGSSLVLLIRQLMELHRGYGRDLENAAISARFPGVFLIVNGANIALLWLSVVVPPVLDGSVYPPELQHYTTLIVQGLDLAFFLPLSVISGVLLLKRRSLGFISGATYLVFLAFLMTALTAKLVAMGMHGAEIFPAIVIIPLTLIVDLCAVVILLRRIGRFLESKQS